MSFQTNEQILRIPPEPLLRRRRLSNYKALITGKLSHRLPARSTRLHAQPLEQRRCCRRASVALALLLGVPAAYAFARFKFRLGEDIAFTLLSFRFAPPLLVLLPLLAVFSAARPRRTPMSG